WQDGGMGTRSRHLLVVPTVLALFVAGCSGGDSTPDPRPAADHLAQGLASGDLSGVTFDGLASAVVGHRYAATVAGLGDVEPEVVVAEVTRSSDTAAAATLSWRWPLGTGWSYH